MHKSRFRVFVLTLSLAAAATLAAGPDEGACDLKTVVKGFYCEGCDEVLIAKDLVSEVVHYVCPECEDVSREAGKCSWCEKNLVKKVSEKGVCKGCLEKPGPADVCEKIYYSCPDCGDMAAKAASCESCEVKFEKQVSRAVIEYVCPGCGEMSLEPGKCTDETCECKGQALERECSSSGEFPHGGQP